MEHRTRIEELDLSLKAYNYVKSNAVQYIDEVQTLVDRYPNRGFVPEIRELLHGWQSYTHAVSKVEAAVEALEALESAAVWDWLPSSRLHVVAEVADTMAAVLALLREPQAGKRPLIPGAHHVDEGYRGGLWNGYNVRWEWECEHEPHATRDEALECVRDELRKRRNRSPEG